MNIRVSYTEMESAAAQLASGRDEITQRLTALQSQIQNLITSGFVTEQASQRFGAAFEQYATGARTVIDRLQDIQTYLRQAANTLRETDSALAAQINH